MSAPNKNQLVAAPDDEVQTSKFCRCFGYISCGECAQDCFVNCNFFALCCNCSRCLQGTCQCIEYIGCVKLAFSCGCSEGCVKQSCKKESPFCMMIFNGIGVMLTAAMAGAYVGFFGNMYMGRVATADELGSKYTCDVDGPDAALEIKDAMGTIELVYLVLLVGSFLSCIAGPVNVLRWIAIPFHLLFGAFFHMYGLFVLWSARYSDAGVACAERQVKPPEVLSQANEDAVFIDDFFLIQVIGMVGFTILASIGCYQERFWDRTAQKKTELKHKAFLEQQQQSKKSMKEEQRTRFMSQAQTELPELAR